MNEDQAQLIYLAFGVRTAAYARAAYEDCDKPPVPISKRRAEGIVAIHAKLHPGDCVRSQAARDYLATLPKESSSWTDERAPWL